MSDHESTETGITNKPSKRFWAGFISYGGLLASLSWAVEHDREAIALGILGAIEVQIVAWLLSIGGTDAIVRGLREWRLAKQGYREEQNGDT